MAEYYAVLKKAVGGPGAGSPEARRAVYDKARNALIGQLKAIDPPLAASEISRQRLELEEAIRRVERETVTQAQSARVVEPPESKPAPSIAPEPGPPAPGQGSPQDIFRRAIQDAEARGSAAGQPEPAPALAAGEPAAGGERRAQRVQNDRRENGRREQNDQSEPTGPVARGTEPVAPEPDYDREWQARGVANRPRESFADEPAAPPPRKRRRPEYYDEDGADEGDEGARRRSFLPTALLFVLIVGMLGGLVALGWSQRTVIADLMSGFDGGPTETAAPDAAPAPPIPSSSKSEDRLAGNAGGDSSVRVIGQPDAAVVPAPPDTSSDPIAEAISASPSAADGAGQLTAVLYEEPLDPAAAATGVTAIDATVSWQLVENGASGAEIQAILDVPERGMKVRLVIRRNTDPTLPASHLVETVVETPADFPGKGVRSAPRLVLKSGEEERGDPLIGAAAKVADGFFWIALSAAEADVQRNLQLLGDRSWIDLPVVYETGQRAILTFEKGAEGSRVFEQAFAAWSTG